MDSDFTYYQWGTNNIDTGSNNTSFFSWHNLTGMMIFLGHVWVAPMSDNKTQVGSNLMVFIGVDVHLDVYHKSTKCRPGYLTVLQTESTSIILLERNQYTCQMVRRFLSYPIRKQHLLVNVSMTNSHLFQTLMVQWPSCVYSSCWLLRSNKVAW